MDYCFILLALPAPDHVTTKCNFEIRNSLTGSRKFWRIKILFEDFAIKILLRILLQGEHSLVEQIFSFSMDHLAVHEKYTAYIVDLSKFFEAFKVSEASKGFRLCSRCSRSLEQHLFKSSLFHLVSRYSAGNSFLERFRHNVRTFKLNVRTRFSIFDLIC